MQWLPVAARNLPDASTRRKTTVAYENLNLHALGIVYKAENTFRAQGLIARHRIISILDIELLLFNGYVDTSIRRLPDTSAFMAIGRNCKNGCIVGHAQRKVIKSQHHSIKSRLNHT